ncbi:sigma-70 family RNA polymerase sigma factor [Escherichia phage UE-S1]|nr:sigma-70 family RNA polymerase sigma factor [Escherichia phage UE-S1]
MKKLDLNAIADEVLDECFSNEEVNTLDALDSVQDEDKVQSNFKFNISLKRPHNVTNEDLIRDIQAGINVKKNTELLVRYNYGLIVDVASKCTCYIPFEDKISYGIEGFMRALKTFDLSKNVKFVTYASSSIYMTVYNESSDANHLVHFPRYMSVNKIQVKRFCHEYERKHGCRPTPELISEGTGIEIQHVKNCLLFQSEYTALDAPLDGVSDGTLSDILHTSDCDYNLNVDSIRAPLRYVINDLTHELSTKEREIIQRVHGLGEFNPESLREIADSGFVDDNGKCVKSRSSVHRKYSEAIKKLKKLVLEKGYEYEDF